MEKTIYVRKDKLPNKLFLLVEHMKLILLHNLANISHIFSNEKDDVLDAFELRQAINMVFKEGRS